MALAPEWSIATGIGTAALVHSVFDSMLPPLVDIRQADSQNQDVQTAERGATWASAALVTGVGLLTQDATVFVIGGAMVIVMAWFYRHADQVSPQTGSATAKLSVPAMTQEQAPEDFGYVDQLV